MKISVIIPVYNVEKYIERCIKSILEQSLQDFEIVIVNDCTLDNSMEIVRRYAVQDKRIRIYNNPENLGLMWTRMVGYKNAKGDYFVFCDSDDWLPQNALQVLYENAIKTDADILAGSFQGVSSGNLYKSICVYTLSFGSDPASIYKSLLNGELNHSLCGKIYKKALFVDYSYDTFKKHTNGEDGVLFYQLVEHCAKICVIPDVVYYYYGNADSSTKKITNRQIEQIIFSFKYTQKIVTNANIDKFLCDKITLQLLLVLLKTTRERNYILSLLDNVDSVKLLSFKSLRRFYARHVLIKNYLILHSWLFRSCYIKGIKTYKR